MEKSDYLAAFHEQSSALITAAEGNLAADIPSCPGWTMTHLVGHMGAIWGSVAKNVDDPDGRDVVQEIEYFGYTPEYEAWLHAGFAPEQAPPDLIDWLRAQAQALEQAFARADPAKPTWTWYEPDQTAAFWMRRMAHEAAIHRWDAQLATRDVPDGFAAPFASDGVDEALTIYVPSHCRPKSELEGNGETFHLHCTDTAGEWVLRFEGKGMTVTREHAKADVAIRGAASDLFLFVWHRLPLVRFDVVGDEVLATRYFALVPAD